MLLCGVYGPNEDSPQFFRMLEAQLELQTESDILICGDFNVTINHQRDNINYQRPRNNRARVELVEIMNRQEIVDVFRVIHGEVKKYSWENDVGPQRARLDYFLISSGLQAAVEEIEITTEVCNSDHKAVVLSLDHDKFVKGKGVWMHPDNLLKDNTYLESTETLTKQ